MISEENVLNSLKRVAYPGYSRDIVSFGLIKDLKIDSDRVSFRVDLTTEDQSVGPKIEADARAVVAGLPGVKKVDIAMDVKTPEEAPSDAHGHNGQHGPSPVNPQPIAGIAQIIAVASAKGGVGKSTVSVNLARALARLGKRVALLDLDIYGPSLPIMIGSGQPPQVEGETIYPAVSDGIELMSIGFFLQDNLPLIWRGPMVIKVVEQFFGQIKWSERDILVIDLPPGTGDAQLSLCQKVRMDGVVMVSTPQEVALADVRRGVVMFRKMGVHLLGVLENMSGLVCPHCGEKVEVFGGSGVQSMAAEMAVPYLGAVPLEPALVKASDNGESLLNIAPESPAATVFKDLAGRLDLRLAAIRQAAGSDSDKGGEWNK